MGSGKIAGHRNHRKALINPFAQHLAHALHHKEINFHNPARLLIIGHEKAGSTDSAAVRRILKSNQRFRPYHAFASDIHLCLVVCHEILPYIRLIQKHFPLLLFPQFPAQFFIISPNHITSAVLDWIHRLNRIGKRQLDVSLPLADLTDAKSLCHADSLFVINIARNPVGHIPHALLQLFYLLKADKEHKVAAVASGIKLPLAVNLRRQFLNGKLQKTLPRAPPVQRIIAFKLTDVRIYDGILFVPVRSQLERRPVFKIIQIPDIEIRVLIHQLLKPSAVFQHAVQHKNS